jgi:hypothetical protein
MQILPIGKTGKRKQRTVKCSRNIKARISNFRSNAKSTQGYG